MLIVNHDLDVAIPNSTRSTSGLLPSGSNRQTGRTPGLAAGSPPPRSCWGRRGGPRWSPTRRRCTAYPLLISQPEQNEWAYSLLCEWLCVTWRFPRTDERKYHHQKFVVAELLQIFVEVEAIKNHIIDHNHIFDQKSHFWSKIAFLTKNHIFDQKSQSSHFWPKITFLT